MSANHRVGVTIITSAMWGHIPALILLSIALSILFATSLGSAPHMPPIRWQDGHLSRGFSCPGWDMPTGPSRYFDPLVIGEKRRSAPSEMTATSIHDFAAAFDPHWLTPDPVASAASPFGDIIAGGRHPIAA